MTDTKYGKYIITEVTTDLFLASGEKKEEGDDPHILNLDDSVIKGALGIQTRWQTPEDFENREPLTPHSHDFDEYLAQFGTDVNNPHDLGAELVVWLGGEKHIITKSCVIYIPKGLVHSLKYNRMDRPIFHFNVCTGKKYKSKSHI
jgi:hypothetical protein